ncbi:alpha/beta fold hydrolase [Nocardia farcinica]|uniref:alpha/beta fold hydrolase n=1 Tax=Nocardia farcinica TaxID=37329 RepID=UPI0011C04CF0|nr:alpha/beta fold hydrolase [Nocardia farcinica]
MGAAAAPASVIYLHCPLTDASYWDPLTQYLQRRLDGGIAQLTYDTREFADPQHSRIHAAVGSSVDVLDAVIGQAQGSVVLVAHSLAWSPLRAWAEHYRAHAHALAGLVVFNPCTAFEPLSRSGPTAPDPVRSSWVDTLREEFATHLHPDPGSDRPERPLTDPGRTFGSGAQFPAHRTRPVSTNAITVLREVPTWVVTGALDPLATPGYARMLAEQLWADFDSVPGVGHHLPYREPAAASAPILAALEAAYRAQRFGGDFL